MQFPPNLAIFIVVAVVVWGAILYAAHRGLRHGGRPQR